MNQAITLRAGKWEGILRPDFGMNLIALRFNGTPVLREPKTEEDLQKTPVLYGIPLLLPPNRTRAGTFVFDGKTYHLPITEPLHNNHIHGAMMKLPFTVLHASERQVCAEYVNYGDCYPFSFRMEITDTLTENGHERVLTVENIGQSDMPLVLAFHTTFAEPPHFSVPLGKRWVTDEHYIPNGTLVPLTDEEQQWCRGSDPRGAVITGFFKADGGTATIGDFLYETEGFDQWILFNARGTSDFLCLEPQLGPVNGLNQENGHMRLRPHEIARFTTRIKLR